MEGKFALLLLITTTASLGSVVIDSPDLASMDPFCAS